MKIELSIKKGDEFFKSNDNKLLICPEGLEEWFDFPGDVDKVTLVVSEQVTCGEDSINIYYYPSVHGVYQEDTYDTYGLTQNGVFEDLCVLDRVVRHIVKQMDLPSQGILNVMLEYEE